MRGKESGKPRLLQQESSLSFEITGGPLARDNRKSSREFGAMQTETDWYNECKELEDDLISVQTEYTRVKGMRVYFGLVHCMIVGLGLVAAALLLGIGIKDRNVEQENEFYSIADNIVMSVDQVWDDYILATSWIHHSCRQYRPNTRQDLRELYGSLREDGYNVTWVGCFLNVTHEERPTFENQTATVYAEVRERLGASKVPPYRGFGASDGSPGSYVTAEEAPFYIISHFVEPIEQALPLLDVNFGDSRAPLFETVDDAIEKKVPALSAALDDRVFIRKQGPSPRAPVSTIVVLMNPGSFSEKYSTTEEPRLGVLVVRINEILEGLSTKIPASLGSTTLYIYDCTDNEISPSVVGGVRYEKKDNNLPHETTFVEPKYLEDVLETKHKYSYDQEILIATRCWTVVVVADKSQFKPNITLIVICAVLLVVASFLAAAYLYSDKRRKSRVTMYKTESAAKTAEVRLETARKAAMAERELNDFIAHEVRNPLSAAISACSFVSSAVTEKEPLITEESRKSVLEDVGIIEASLHFINDLLRNMLDMHRAASNEMKIEMSYTEVKSDVLDPAVALLYKRDSNFEVLVDCAPDLVIRTDKLRLKQVVLNLARNSAKFVEKGFIRLRGAHVDNHVVLYVEDSGPGIPEEKKKKLFSKFQESLDSLQQGTGIGLAVCHKLVNLLDGSITLDESYHSGIEGCPGARFVINLNTPAVALKSLSLTHMEVDPSETESMHSPESDLGTPSVTDQEVSSDPIADETVVKTEKKVRVQEIVLPDELSVLFVDDDVLLRKLFMRSMKRFLPAWNVKEASSGEAALLKVKEESFDLIFMDQYMASVGRQMLGTETVRALRSNGVESIICGLSANDMEVHFLNAGANAFMIKPFPCVEKQLRSEIDRILQTSTTQVGNSLSTISGEEVARQQDGIYGRMDEESEILDKKGVES